MLTTDERVRFALIDLKRLASERTLLKGHFALVAKRHNVTVKELKAAFNNVTD